MSDREPPRRQPLTITDEGNGKFIASCGGRYSNPDYRWNILGVVMEWFLDGEHEEHFQSAEEHKRIAHCVAQIMRDSEDE